jgi:hypothetical protein
MNDMQDEVRQLLRDKATEMPPHLDVPPSLQKRVRPRIARNAVLMAAAAAAVTVVAVAGFRSFNEPPDERSLGDPQAGLGQCTVDQLAPSTVLGGAAGSRVGSIVLQNTGATCTLSGDPDVAVGDGDQRIFDLDLSYSDPTWMVDRAPKPDGWPLVTLAQGESASVRISWSNWCHPDVAPVLQLQAQDGSLVANIPAAPLDLPPCNGAVGSTTIIEVGPFEPSA